MGDSWTGTHLSVLVCHECTTYVVKKIVLFTTFLRYLLCILSWFTLHFFNRELNNYELNSQNILSKSIWCVRITQPVDVIIWYFNTSFGTLYRVFTYLSDHLYFGTEGIYGIFKNNFLMLWFLENKGMYVHKQKYCYQ